jgi:lipoyl(octanoyl) transferase
MPPKQIHFEWLGPTDYASGLELQHQAWTRCREEGRTTILGLEHPPVVTLGKRANEKMDLKTSRADLNTLGIQVADVDRGGEAVLHSPGQLVIYPIFDLEKWDISVREFIEILEKSCVRFLEQLQVKAHVGADEPGIYTAKGKIAFVGLRVDRGITRHGIAINISNDLSLFEHIRCCGKADETFDRLAHYGVNATQVQLFRRWSECLKWSLNLTPRPNSDYSSIILQAQA